MRSQRGLTFAELMITIVILGILAVLGIPALSSITATKEKSAVKEIGQTYLWLIEEASVRNVVFRVQFNLDSRSWKVEVADPNTMIFASPEAAEEFQERVEEDRTELPASFSQQGESEDEDVVDLRDAGKRFEGLESELFTTGQTLPEGLMFDFIYTPQYGEDGIRPSTEDSEKDAIAYSHIFPDNTAEHTVIRIVAIDDVEDGYTLEVEPMTGNIRITSDIISPTESMSWVPDEGPTLQ